MEVERSLHFVQLAAQRERMSQDVERKDDEDQVVVLRVPEGQVGGSDAKGVEEDRVTPRILTQNLERAVVVCVARCIWVGFAEFFGENMISGSKHIIHTTVDLLLTCYGSWVTGIVLFRFVCHASSNQTVAHTSISVVRTS